MLMSLTTHSHCEYSFLLNSHCTPVATAVTINQQSCRQENISSHTPRVRSRSEDRRARPEGGGRGSRAPTATAGSLSAAADGPPKADSIARRRRGSHKTPNNVTFHPLRRVARYFGPSTAS